MATKDIVVIGTSAGGVHALRRVAEGLAHDFNGSIFVVMHTAAESPQVLAQAIGNAGPMPAKYATDGESIEAGQIYVAPVDHHLIIEPDIMRLTRGPKENRFRPAVDPLFRSAAQAYGSRVIGVILTGALDDGTAGLQAVKRLGGVAIVQDPKEAFASSMPSSALAHVSVDHCVPLNEIGPLLSKLAHNPREQEGGLVVPDDIKTEVNIAKGERAIDAGVEALGEPSRFACPDCHGVLLRLKETNPERFRCHTGHGYTVDTLLEDMSQKSDDSLWTAMRSLEEEALLTRHLARHLEDAEVGDRTKELITRSREIESRADLVRQAAVRRNEPTS